MRSGQAVRVLVVDDDFISTEILQNALVELNYDVTVAYDGLEALSLLRSGRYRIVITDWQMPGMSGLEVCQEIRRRKTAGYVYVILLTANNRPDQIVAGLKAGADDYMTKPFHLEELTLRLRVGERMLALEGRDMMIFAMAKLAESRDPETGAHLERIREYCRILAEELSGSDECREIVDGEYIRAIYMTSPLHDIGKVGIPDHILLKEGPLTAAEFEVMKGHAEIGGQTLDAVVQTHADAHFLTMARDIAWTHHERFDGRGYPRGLSGEEIPLCGRIVALADVYDALTTKRVYKPAFSHEKSREIILEGRGSQFDPQVVDAFVLREAEIRELGRRLACGEAGDRPGESPGDIGHGPASFLPSRTALATASAC
jgi:putative two-component system response regulator